MSDLASKAPPDELFELATDVWTEPFWHAAREHRLVHPFCKNCGNVRELGAPFCHHCLSQEVDWRQLNGRGIVHTFTVVRFPVIEAMKECVPYVPAVISLDGAEGARLISNIVDAPLNEIRIGAQVAVCWHDRPDGVSVPRFRLV